MRSMLRRVSIYADDRQEACQYMYVRKLGRFSASSEYQWHWFCSDRSRSRSMDGENL